MHDPVVVRDLQRVGRLMDDACRPRPRQRAGVLDDVRERLPLDELHREVDQPLGRLSEIINRADVRMVHPAGVGRLAIEPRDRVRVLVRPGIHHLDRALAPHLHVLGEVDAPHAAFAELLDDVVAIRDHRSHEVALLRRALERGAVARAEPLGHRVLGAARRAELEVAHKLSTRNIWSPSRMRAPLPSSRSPRTATATPLRLPASCA